LCFVCFCKHLIANHEISQPLWIPSQSEKLKGVEFFILFWE
jgi:hypothetical protein